MAGIKFLITSLRNTANEGCEKVWKELRRDYASGTTTTQQSQPFNNNIIAEFDTTNELNVVKWSIDQGATVQRNNNYQISGQFNPSLIPCSAIINAANTRRHRDQTLIFETKFQELMQLFLYRVNCPVYRLFDHKENANNQVMVWQDKSNDNCFTSSITELGDDDLLIDDQSTRQTDDIMDDDSQTGDASIDDGGSGEPGKDDKKTNVKKKKPKQRAKVTSWTCFQCPKV